MVRPIFEAWLEPFQDLGAEHHHDPQYRRNGSPVALTPWACRDSSSFRTRWSTTRTHHSNMDVYDHVQPGDLMQASAIMAAFVYNTAMRRRDAPAQAAPETAAGRTGRSDGVRRLAVKLWCDNGPHALDAAFPCCFFHCLAADSVDLAVVNRIKAEAFQNSKVMEHLENMTDRYGPRLTGSPEFKEAADWALKQLAGLWPCERASRKMGAIRT